MAPRARAFAGIFSYLLMTGVGFYFVSNHNEFAAIFGTFAVAAAASVVFFAILLVARLMRAIKGRF